MTCECATPVVDVAHAIRAHHRELATNVAARTAAVRDAAERLQNATRACEELIGYLVTQVLPHAAAEEGTLYAAGGLLTSTQLLVRSMTEEHRQLERLVTELGAARTPVEMVAAAASVRTLFDVHLAKENDFLLPALQTAGVELGSLIEGMHEILGGHSSSHDVPADVLDVRSLPRGLRHEEVFRALDALSAGESFVLVNDHDPKRLRAQLEAKRPGLVGWVYLEEGPEVWQVRIELLAQPASLP
jgi:uncharacterized protein (DUF2249 family)